MNARWPACALALLVVAGAIKSTPLGASLLVDLTALCAVLIALAAYNTVLGALTKQPEAIRWAWMLGAVGFGLLGIFRAPATDYATAKTQALLALTLGCAFVGGLLLVRTERQRVALVWATVIAGLLVALLAYLEPTTNAELLGRVALGDDNTIAPARAAGSAVVAVVSLAASRRLRLVPALVITGALLALMLATGSRGPLVAAVAALVALVPFLPSAKHRARALAVFAVVGLLGARFFVGSASSARDRFLLLFAQDKGDSIFARQTMWGEAWRSFQEHPLGVGWGGLQQVLYPIDRYPHSIVLEVAGEAGIFGLAALVVAVVVAVRRAGRAARAGDTSALCVLTLLVFWLVNAMVSGDLNDNRGLFVMLGACLALGRGLVVHDSAGLEYGQERRERSVPAA